jgi:hypothetical protein
VPGFAGPFKVGQPGNVSMLPRDNMPIILLRLKFTMEFILFWGLNVFPKTSPGEQLAQCNLIFGLAAVL